MHKAKDLASALKEYSFQDMPSVKMESLNISRGEK